MRPTLRTLTPVLVVSDLERALAFYRDRLGFTRVSVHGEPPCFAMLGRDGLEIFLSVAESPAHVAPNGPHGVWDLALVVSDIAAECVALAAAGVPLATGPRDTFYDMREVEVLDPDGHRICLAEDLSARAADTTWQGDLDLGTRRLQLVLRVVAGTKGPRAWLDSPDQGAHNLPIDAFHDDGRTVRCGLAAIGATFAGTYAEEGRVLTGTWSQGGRQWPLTFRR